MKWKFYQRLKDRIKLAEKRTSEIENILTETEHLPGIIVEEGARLLFNVLSVAALLAWMSRCVVNTPI